MKNLLVFLLLGTILSAQKTKDWQFDIQFAGSNLLGFSFDMERQFQIKEYGNQRLGIGTGAGFGGFGNSILWKLESHYYYKHLSYGLEFALLGDNPLLPGWLLVETPLDVILYPNIGYTWTLKNSRSLSLSFGAFIPFEREIRNYYNRLEPVRLYALDVVPMIGLSYGFPLKSKNFSAVEGERFK